MPQTEWLKIADTIPELNLNANGIGIIELKGKKYTIALFKNALSACAYKCPHASGIMADGWIDATGNIVCPLHRYKFSVQTGRNISGEGYYLKTYPIKHDETGIYIAIEKNIF